MTNKFITLDTGTIVSLLSALHSPTEAMKKMHVGCAFYKTSPYTFFRNMVQFLQQTCVVEGAHQCNCFSYSGNVAARISFHVSGTPGKHQLEQSALGLAGDDIHGCPSPL